MLPAPNPRSDAFASSIAEPKSSTALPASSDAPRTFSIPVAARCIPRPVARASLFTRSSISRTSSSSDASAVLSDAKRVVPSMLLANASGALLRERSIALRCLTVSLVSMPRVATPSEKSLTLLRASSSSVVASARSVANLRKSRSSFSRFSLALAVSNSIRIPRVIVIVCPVLWPVTPLDAWTLPAHRPQI